LKVWALLVFVVLGKKGRVGGWRAGKEWKEREEMFLWF